MSRSETAPDGVPYSSSGPAGALIQTCREDRGGRMCQLSSKRVSADSGFSLSRTTWNTLDELRIYAAGKGCGSDQFEEALRLVGTDTFRVANHLQRDMLICWRVQGSD